MTLDEIRQNAVAEIEAAGELRRCTVTSFLATKNDIYQAKASLADAAVAGSTEAQTMLAIEATARGLTWQQLAAVIQAKRTSWLTAAFTIAAAEASGQAAVLVAHSQAEVSAAAADAIAEIHAVR